MLNSEKIDFEYGYEDPIPVSKKTSSLDDYDSIIAEASEAHGVEPELIKAIIKIESTGKPKAKSSKGAQGLMQIMPETAEELGIKDITNPRENIFGGTKYISKQLENTGGDVALALASYNAGPTVVKRHGGIPPFKETQQYVKKVQNEYKKLKGKGFVIPKPSSKKIEPLDYDNPDFEAYDEIEQSDEFDFEGTSEVSTPAIAPTPKQKEPDLGLPMAEAGGFLPGQPVAEQPVVEQIPKAGMEMTKVTSVSEPEPLKPIITPEEAIDHSIKVLSQAIHGMQIAEQTKPEREARVQAENIDHALKVLDQTRMGMQVAKATQPEREKKAAMPLFSEFAPEVGEPEVLGKALDLPLVPGRTLSRFPGMETEVTAPEGIEKPKPSPSELGGELMGTIAQYLHDVEGPKKTKFKKGEPTPFEAGKEAGKLITEIGFEFAGADAIFKALGTGVNTLFNRLSKTKWFKNLSQADKQSYFANAAHMADSMKAQGASDAEVLQALRKYSGPGRQEAFKKYFELARKESQKASGMTADQILKKEAEEITKEILSKAKTKKLPAPEIGPKPPEPTTEGPIVPKKPTPPKPVEPKTELAKKLKIEIKKEKQPSPLVALTKKETELKAVPKKPEAKPKPLKLMGSDEKETIGKTLAKKYGVQYKGYWKEIKKEMFNMDVGKGMMETFYSDSLDEADVKKALEKTRKKWGITDRRIVPDARELEIEQRKGERRDLALRKSVEQMSPEEKAFAIPELRRMNKERLKDIAKLKKGNIIDPLTGLRNREGISKSIGRAEKAGKEAQYTFIDLIGFKGLNDKIGYKAGDQALEHIGSAIKSLKLKGARTGGDEFGILSDTEAEAEASVEALKNYFEKNQVRVTDKKGKKYDVNILFRHGTAKIDYSGKDIPAKTKAAQDAAEAKKATEPEEWKRGEAHPGLTPIKKQKVAKVSKRGANVRTLRGFVKYINKIDYLNYKGEVKSLPKSGQFLFKRGGTPIDDAVRQLVDAGYLPPDTDVANFFERLRTEPDLVKQGPIYQKTQEEILEGKKSEAELTDQEKRFKEESEWEPEEPPEGDYVTMTADELPEGKKLTLIEGKTATGWDTYEVIEKDPFSITLKDGNTVELKPHDKVHVLKKDLDKPDKAEKLSVISKDDLGLFEFNTGNEWNEDQIKQYQEDIKAGKPIDPIEVSFGDKGQIYVVDGHHRALAAQREGFEIPYVETDEAGHAGVEFMDWEKAPAFETEPKFKVGEKTFENPIEKGFSQVKEALDLFGGKKPGQVELFSIPKPEATKKERVARKEKPPPREAQLDLFTGKQDQPIQDRLFSDFVKKEPTKEPKKKVYVPDKSKVEGAGVWVETSPTGRVFESPSLVVKNASEVASLLSKIGKQARESIYSVTVDKDGNILEIFEQAKGSKGSSNAHPVEIAGHILNIPEARKVYFVHNHPSGLDVTPSKEDLSFGDVFTGIVSLKNIELIPMIISKNKWSLFYEYTSSPETEIVDIPALSKKEKIDVVETILGEGTVGEQINTLGKLDDVLKNKYQGKEGILFFNNKLNDLGFLPWPSGISSKKATARIIAAAEALNAAAYMINLNQPITYKNRLPFIREFIRNLQNGGLPIVDINEMGLSHAQAGILGPMIPPENQKAPKPFLGSLKSDTILYSGIPVHELIETSKGLARLYDKHVGLPLWEFLSEKVPVALGDRAVIIDAINKGIILDYKKHPAFIELRDETVTNIEIARHTAKELARVMKEFPRAEQIRISQIIRGSITQMPERYKAAFETVEKFKMLEERLQKLGILGPDNIFRQLTRKELAKKFNDIKALNDEIKMLKKRLQPIIKKGRTIKRSSEATFEEIKNTITETKTGKYKTDTKKWTKLNEDRVREALMSRGFSEGESNQMIERVKQSVVEIESKEGTYKEIVTTLEKVVTKTITHEIERIKTYSRSYMARAKGSILRDIKKVVNKRNDILKRIQTHYKMSGKQYLRRAYESIETEENFLAKLMGYATRRPRLKKGYNIQRKDLSKEYRKALGEIEKAPYLVYKGLSEEYHDMYLMEMFNKISQNKLWAVSPKEWDNIIKVQSREHLRKHYEKFKPLPMSDKLGKLSGAMIDPYIWDDLNEAVKQVSEIMKAYDKMLNLWKIGKVPYNPAPQCRNILSNTILADFAGLSPLRIDIYVKAARDLLTQTGYYLEAKGATSLLGKEWIGGEIEEFLTDVSEFEGKGSFAVEAAKWITKLANKPLIVYQGIEQFFKLAVYIHQREAGASIKDAAKHAEHWIFNYQKIPPAIRWAKRWYSPFITFSYKAMPRMAETAIRKPWKIAKYAALMYAVEEITRRMYGESKEEVEREKKVLPDYMRKSVLPGQICHLRIPKPRDKYNRSKYLDLSFILPWGDVAEQWGQSHLTGRPFLPSHPLYVVSAEIAFNEVLFTGQPLTVKGVDEGMDYAKKIGTQIWRQAAPSLVGSYSYNKLMAAIYGEKDWALRDRSIGEAVFDVFLGLKIRSIDYNEEHARRIRELNKNIMEIRTRFSEDYERIFVRNPTPDYDHDVKRFEKMAEKKDKEIQRIMDKITEMEK